MYKNLYKRIKYNGGLTLIELMVVISIFLVITSTALFNYGGFNSTVSLQNLTDDIALSIRKAQGFAIGARAVGDTGFNNSYGVHFSVNPNSSNLDSSIRSFLMFSVPIPGKKYIVGTGSCDGKSSSNMCMEFFNIMTADKILKITVIKNSTPTILSLNAYVDIVFTRPDPRAYICYRTSSNANCENYSNVDIIISNGDTDPTKEKCKMISVQNTGQISIQNSNCTQ